MRAPDHDQLRTHLEAIRPLRASTPGERLSIIAPVLERWQDSHAPERQRLLAGLPRATGFSPEMIEVGVALAAGRLAPDVLDAAIAANHPRLSGDHPRRTVVVSAGNVPGLAPLDLVWSVLAGDPVAVKLSSTEPVTGSALAEGLHEHVGEAPAVAFVWSGGDRARNDVLHDWADRLLVSGRTATVRAAVARFAEIRAATGRVLSPGDAQGFGHRISVAWIPPEGFALEETAIRLAVDTALWDQEGCLSPHVAFVGRGVDARELGARIARELERLDVRLPRGELPREMSVAVRRLTLDTEARMLARDDVDLWAGPRWAVVLDSASGLCPSPLGRTLFLREVESEEAFLHALTPWANVVQCVGVADEPAGFAHLAHALAALDVTRLCAVGRMQEPGPSWWGEERDADGRMRFALEPEVDGIWRTLAGSRDGEGSIRRW